MLYKQVPFVAAGTAGVANYEQGPAFLAVEGLQLHVVPKQKIDVDKVVDQHDLVDDQRLYAEKDQFMQVKIDPTEAVVQNTPHCEMWLKRKMFVWDNYVPKWHIFSFTEMRHENYCNSEGLQMLCTEQRWTGGFSDAKETCNNEDYKMEFEKTGKNEVSDSVQQIVAKYSGINIGSSGTATLLSALLKEILDETASPTCGQDLIEQFDVIILKEPIFKKLLRGIAPTIFDGNLMDKFSKDKTRDILFNDFENLNVDIKADSAAWENNIKAIFDDTDSHRDVSSMVQRVRAWIKMSQLTYEIRVKSRNFTAEEHAEKVGIIKNLTTFVEGQ